MLAWIDGFSPEYSFNQNTLHINCTLVMFRALWYKEARDILGTSWSLQTGGGNYVTGQYMIDALFEFEFRV